MKLRWPGCLFLFLCCSAVVASDLHWKGVVNDQWDWRENWSLEPGTVVMPRRPPDRGDTIILQSAASSRTRLRMGDNVRYVDRIVTDPSFIGMEIGSDTDYDLFWVLTLAAREPLDTSAGIAGSLVIRLTNLVLSASESVTVRIGRDVVLRGRSDRADSAWLDLPGATEFVKEGPGLLEIQGGMGLAGDLTIRAGVLRVQRPPALSDHGLRIEGTGQLDPCGDWDVGDLRIDGVPVAPGFYTAAELRALYPHRFPSGGSGSIVVGGGHPRLFWTGAVDDRMAGAGNWSLDVTGTAPASAPPGGAEVVVIRAGSTSGTGLRQGASRSLFAVETSDAFSGFQWGGVEDVDAGHQLELRGSRPLDTRRGASVLAFRESELVLSSPGTVTVHSGDIISVLHRSGSFTGLGRLSVPRAERLVKEGPGRFHIDGSLAFQGDIEVRNGVLGIVRGFDGP